MATFTHTDAVLGNLIASGAVAVSASVSSTLDLRLQLQATVRVDVTYGAVTAGTFTTVQWFSMPDGTTAPGANAVPDGQFSLTPVAGATVQRAFVLPGGEKYTVLLVNGDGTNAITARASNDLVTGMS